MKYTIDEFKENVVKWSTNRLIIQNGNIAGQQQKGREECAETIMEINNIVDNGRTYENLLELKKEVGDIAVILVNVDYMQESDSDYYFNPVLSGSADAEPIYGVAVALISKLHTFIELGIEQYTELWDLLEVICVYLNISLSECAYLAFKKIEFRKGYFCKESMSFIKEV